MNCDRSTQNGKETNGRLSYFMNIEEILCDPHHLNIQSQTRQDYLILKKDKTIWESILDILADHRHWFYNNTQKFIFDLFCTQNNIVNTL